MSRRISVSNPAIQAGPLLQQSYTPDRLIASLTDANGNTTSFTPDGFDRLATTTYPGSSTETLSYDADGNVLSRKTRAGATITFSYDTLNRLSMKAAPSEATVTYGYDLATNGCAACATSPSFTNGCCPISASSGRRWSGSALAGGSPPRWRRWRPARCTGWCWSVRWG